MDERPDEPDSGDDAHYIPAFDRRVRTGFASYGPKRSLWRRLTWRFTRPAGAPKRRPR